MKQKGFSLIELLVVVAIIGILAAVGVVAYNGYTGAAKRNASKANHKTVVNFIAASIAKCEIGEKLILKFDPTIDHCSYVLTGNADGLATVFTNHFKILKWCNPYGWQGGSNCAEAVEGGGTVGEGTPGATKLLTQSGSPSTLFIDTKYTCEPAALSETCRQGKSLTNSIKLQ